MEMFEFSHMFFVAPYSEINDFYPHYHLGVINPIEGFEEFKLGEKMKSAKRRKQLDAYFERIVNFENENGDILEEVTIPIIPVSKKCQGDYLYEIQTVRY